MDIKLNDGVKFFVFKYLGNTRTSVNLYWMYKVFIFICNIFHFYKYLRAQLDLGADTLSCKAALDVVRFA